MKVSQASISDIGLLLLMLASPFLLYGFFWVFDVLRSRGRISSGVSDLAIDALRRANATRRSTKNVDLPRKVLPKNEHKGVYGAIIVMVCGILYYGAQVLTKEQDPDAQALEAIKGLLEGHFIQAPSTAKWLNQRILKHEGPYWSGYFEVDAQNQYGVMMRRHICAVAEIRGTQVVMKDTSRSVLDNCNPGNEAYMSILYGMSEWGKNLTNNPARP